MAQVNISHFTDITADEARLFTLAVRDAAAKEVHGLEKQQIEPDSVTVLVIPIDIAASLSGAETEVQVLVSGNNWPHGADAAEAKIHFDTLAAKIHRSLSKQTNRKIYVWVTPFTASGWAA